MECAMDVGAAAKIGEFLPKGFLVKGIPAVTISIKAEQKYHGQMKTLSDSLTGAVKLV